MKTVAAILISSSLLFSAATSGQRGKLFGFPHYVEFHNALHPSAVLPQKKAQWPSFRGDHAAGVAEGQGLPEQWDGQKGVNIKWKTAIPGLAHSSPIVWGSTVFVTTAVSSRGGDTFKHGLYGEGTASEDLSVQKMEAICNRSREWQHSLGTNRL